MIRTLTMAIRWWIVLLALAFAIFYILDMERVYRLLFILMGFTYGFTALFEAWVVGLDTGRGKFIALLSTMGFTAALAVWFGGYVWHLLFRLAILLAVAFMYLNLRFKLHIRLGFWKRVIAIALGIIVILFTYLFSGLIEASTLREIILWIDAVSLILIIVNFLMYLGGDIGKVWLAGVVAMLILLAGDIFFLLDVPRNVELVFWFIPIFIMNNVALRVIEEE